MLRIGVIPARGGSKRVPRKNVRPFHGRPMIEWTIRAAQGSGVVDRIIVSTDDPEIADVASRAGAEVPFSRPASLSDDMTHVGPVVEHALAFLAEQGVQPAYVVTLLATAPLMQASDIRDGLTLLQSRPDCRSVVAVTHFGYPIQRALQITPEGTLAMMQPEHRLTRSQDLPQAYHDAGQFYWSRRDLPDAPNLSGDASLPYLIPPWRVQDIDTPEDWERAEKLFAASLG